METIKLPVLLIALASVVALLIFLSGIRVDASTQAYISVVFIFLLISFNRWQITGYWRILFVCLSAFIVLRYFSWRLFYTLGYHDLFSSIGAITLFLAEIYGGIMFFLTVFVNVQPLDRKSVPLPLDSSLWPTVDIIIPSYDEPVDLVKITLAAAGNVDYPAEKLKVFLLDDGGTTEKLNSKDKKVRSGAQERRQSFNELCRELGITYLSRERNENAKAGNMNAALKHLSSDLILVLDADHAPATDILQKTVGSFIADEKVFLVQTPHFFINPDPIEKNLNLFHRMPPENYMFYSAIQRGLDFWQSSFFCGSAAVIKRKALDEVGGFSGMTITEDSETALKLHSRGWRSEYIMHPLIAGLQPETFSSFMIQRMRWAQGMVQNFILQNPLFLPNLKIWQRLSYLSNMLFWFFPFARLIFLIAPGLYLFFGLKIYNANLIEFFSYTVPYLLALVQTNHYLFSKVRWIFVSEIYETMQSLFSIRAIWAVLKDPLKPQFSVTPKMETLEQDFISPLAQPFYWTIVLTLLAACFGIWRFFLYPEEQALISITLFWSIFNLILLLAALGALCEQKQRRVFPRIPVNIEGKWLQHANKANQIPISFRDISMGGGNIVSSQPLASDGADYKQAAKIEVIGADGQLEHYRAVITNSFKKNEQYVYGIKFLHADMPEFVRVVRFVHGDSSRWVDLQELVSANPGLLKTIAYMITIGIKHGLTHILIILSSLFKKPVAI